MRVLVVAAVVLHVAAAYAQPSPAQPTRTERYGTTIAIADGISVAALGTGIALIATHNSGGARVVGILSTTVGAAGYVWASPIVHYMRDRDELSKVDIGLRIIIPGLAAGIAAGVASCPDGEKTCDDKTRAIVIAGGAGIAVMSALDIAVFAKQQVPYVAPANGGATVGFAGRF